MPPGRIAIRSVADVEALKGRDLAPSGWVRVEQRAIDAFADATGDRQWIHVDAERARHSSFGTTIAHGHLVLGMVPVLVHDILDLGALVASINYGCNRVRFPAPAPAGCQLRLRLRVLDVHRLPGGCRVSFDYRMERAGLSRPVCVAEMISQWLFQQVAAP